MMLDKSWQPWYCISCGGRKLLVSNNCGVIAFLVLVHGVVGECIRAVEDGLAIFQRRNSNIGRKVPPWMYT